MSGPRRRFALVVVASVLLAVAMSLPPTAPGLAFWAPLALACAAALAWGWLSQRAGG